MRSKLKNKSLRAGIETFPRGTSPVRHQHTESYASIILAGTFIEAGFSGRVDVKPGDVLLHGSFDCHANHSTCLRSVQILRLPWLADGVEGHFRVADPDLLARLAERDPHESMDALAESLIPAAVPQACWTARLASDLQRTSFQSLRSWATALGVRPEVLSRGFHRDFGVSPKQFRLQARARRAWQKLLTSPSSLTTIAHDFGFSDLAHLSRSIRFLTGHPPSYWRNRARNCVQA